MPLGLLGTEQARRRTTKTFMNNITDNANETPPAEPQIPTPLGPAGSEPVPTEKATIVITSILGVHMREDCEVVYASLECKTGELSGKTFTAGLFLTDLIGHPGHHLLVGKSW